MLQGTWKINGKMAKSTLKLSLSASWGSARRRTAACCEWPTFRHVTFQRQIGLKMSFLLHRCDTLVALEIPGRYISRIYIWHCFFICFSIYDFVFGGKFVQQLNNNYKTNQQKLEDLMKSLDIPNCCTKTATGWWFQPIWKISVKLEIFPK